MDIEIKQIIAVTDSYNNIIVLGLCVDSRVYQWINGGWGEYDK